MEMQRAEELLAVYKKTPNGTGFGAVVKYLYGYTEKEAGLYWHLIDYGILEGRTNGKGGDN